MHAGIDFGAQKAGTTAICYNLNESLYMIQSTKGKQADEFIMAFVKEQQPASVFIDAPLSLPKAYYGKGDDFFYRVADRQAQAMSPLFLGGLTARAIHVKKKLAQLHIPCYEAYPKHVVKALLHGSFEKYKKANYLAEFTFQLNRVLPLRLCEPPSNFHQIDAILAWIAGYRYNNNEHLAFGEEPEGVILA